MKIKLHVVLSGQSINEVRTNRIFEIVIDIDLSKDNNIGNLLKQKIVVGRNYTENASSYTISSLPNPAGGKLNEHIVDLLNYSPSTQILEGTALALRLLCNGYVNDLVADGWKELT